MERGATLANEHLIADLRLKLRPRTDEDLLAIWMENDQEQWSAEYFEAVRLVLTQRGLALPPQGAAGSGPRGSGAVHRLDYEVPPQPTRLQRFWKGLWTSVVIWMLCGWAIIVLDLIGSGKLDIWPAAPVVSKPVPGPASPTTHP